MRRPGAALVALWALAGCGFEPSGLRAGDAASADGTRPPMAPDARPCFGAADGEGHCYVFQPTPSTWPDAETACEANGMHLAVIADAVQNATVSAIAAPAGFTYIGATDQVTEGTFVWVDGTALTMNQLPLPGVYTNFNGGEPNNGGGGYEEDCLAMRTDGKWDDKNCVLETGDPDLLQPSVCEYTVALSPRT